MGVGVRCRRERMSGFAGKVVCCVEKDAWCRERMSGFAGKVVCCVEKDGFVGKVVCCREDKEKCGVENV